MNKKIELLIYSILRFFKKDISEQTVETLTQFILFGIVGISNTIISYLINIIILIMLHPLVLAWDYIAGNIVAFLLSVLWSFYWNNQMVFVSKKGQRRNLWKALLKAYAAYGCTGIILNNVLSWLWITIFHISKYVAPLINLIISVPLNFVINKLWTFKDDDRNIKT